MQPRRASTFIATIALTLAIAVLPAIPTAEAVAEDGRPYDDKLMRLSEILGAIHYLRALCGATDGQKWRDAMEDLIKSEGTTALRRAVLARQFNRGYRGYGRTHRNCSPTAKSTISRFIVEAVEISDELTRLAR
jgi:uncharacterized protein (TIGR02301 family)